MYTELRELQSKFTLGWCVYMYSATANMKVGYMEASYNATNSATWAQNV
jgi:hypothetical protein